MSIQSVESPQDRPSQPLLDKTMWAAVASLSAVVGRFAAGVITARILGPDGAGRLAYLLWLVDIVATVAGFGLSTTITRFSADLQGKGRQDLAGSLGRWVFARFAVLTLAGGATVAIIGHLSRSAETTSATWWFLTFYFCLQSLSTLYLAQLAGRQRFDVSAKIGILSNVLLVAGVSAGTFSFGLSGTVAGYVIGAALPGVLSFAMLRNGGSGTEPLSPDLRKRVVALAGYSWLNAIVSAFVWSRIEVFFLERYWDGWTISMFTTGAALSVLASQGPSMLITPLMPHFAELVGGKDLDRVRRTYSVSTCLTALLLFPLALGLASVMPVLLPMLYGEAFRDAVPNAVILVAFSSVGIVNVSTAMLYGLEKARFLFWVNVPFALLSVASGMLILPRYGASGAAWSRAAMQTGILLLVLWYVRYRVNCSVPFAQLGRILACACLCAGASYLAVEMIPAPWSVPAAVALGAVAYALALRVLRPLTADDAAYVKQALNRLPARAVRPVSNLMSCLLAID